MKVSNINHCISYRQIFGEDRERDMTQDEDTLYAKMFKQVEAAAAA